MNKNMSVIDEYKAKVVRITVLIIIISATMAGIVFPVMKLFGLYPTASWSILLIFLAVVVLEDIIGIYYIRTSLVDGRLDKNKEKQIKIFTSLLCYINFNFIIWMVPSKELWSFAAYFLILMAMMLDLKMILISVVVFLGSVGILFLFRPASLPAEEVFLSDLLLRGVNLSLTYFGIVVLVYFAGSILMNAKKEEVEKNNNRTSALISKVTSLSEKLGDASKILLESSQNESASTEELSAISENLLKNSEAILDKTSTSKGNLSELENSSRKMAEKMSEIDTISNQLSSISASNEASLNDLMAISENVKTSTSNTMAVTNRLLEEAGEIGSTLGIINEITDSIDLLSLNASIEAARAGESGKGFAVVAQEIGHLADSTKTSIQNIELVVSGVQNGVQEVSRFMTENTSILLKQNEVLVETVSGIRSMMDLLKKSAENIYTADGLQRTQDQIISKTVSINEDIAESIYHENEDFINITELVQSNTEDINQLVKQIDLLNEMVVQLEEILSE